MFVLFVLFVLFEARNTCAHSCSAATFEMDIVMEAFDGDAVMAQLENPFVMNPVVALVLIWALLRFRERVVNRRIAREAMQRRRDYGRTYVNEVAPELLNDFMFRRISVAQRVRDGSDELWVTRR